MKMKWLDSWIFEGYRTRSSDLAVYRILYSAYVLLVWLPMGLWLRHVPQAFFNPPVSLAALFTTFPPTFILSALNVLLALFVSMLLVGLLTRVASVGTCIVLLVIRSWEYSLGKINSDILLVITPLVLAFSCWGDVFSLDALRRSTPAPNTLRGSWNLTLLALLIGIAMFTSGWAKVSTGWLDPMTQSTYGYFVYYYVTGEPCWVADLALRIEFAWLWKLADWFTAALEIGFLFAAFHRRAMYIFMAIACLFHLSVWLLFDIVFTHNIITYGAFVRYSTLPLLSQGIEMIPKLHPFRFMPVWVLGWVILATAFLMTLVALLVQRPLASLLHMPLNKMIILLSVGFSCGYLVGLFTRQFHSHSG